jgi:hypothetical protein
VQLSKRHKFPPAAHEHFIQTTHEARSWLNTTTAGHHSDPTSRDRRRLSQPSQLCNVRPIPNLWLSDAQSFASTSDASRRVEKGVSCWEYATDTKAEDDTFAETRVVLSGLKAPPIVMPCATVCTG